MSIQGLPVFDTINYRKLGYGLNTKYCFLPVKSWVPLSNIRQMYNTDDFKAVLA